MKKKNLSRRPPKSALLAAALAGAAISGDPAAAAALTYDADPGTPGVQDGSGTGWNITELNWFDGTSNVAWPNTAADTALFGAGSGDAGAVTVGLVTTNGITFNPVGQGIYTLTGGTITLAGTAPAIMANVDAVIASVLAGTPGFVKSGPGTLQLSNTTANTYTGPTIVNQGKLLATGGGALRNTSGVSVAPGATLEIGGTNILTAGHGTATSNVPLASRVISVNAGLLLMNPSAELRIGNVTLNNGAVWTSDRGLASYDVLLANVRTGAGPATVTVGGTGASLMNGTGGIHLQGVQNFEVADTTGSAAVDLEVSMILGLNGTSAGAAGGINKLGAGTMALRANNLYLGSTIVNAGTLVCTGSNSGSAAMVNSGGVLRLDYSGTATGNILDAGKPLTLAGGTCHVFGNATAAASQTFASLAVGAGISTISLTNNGAPATGLVFTGGTISQTGGGVVNFLPSPASTNIRLGSAANPLIGAYALYRNSNYAATDATGNVTGAAAGTPAAGVNAFTVPAGNYVYNSPGAVDTLTASRTANTVVFATAAPQTIDLGGDATAYTLTLNGFINNGGALTLQRGATSTGSFVAGTATNGGTVIGGTGNVTFAVPIENSPGGASTFANANTGTVTLSTVNTYTGATYNDTGTLVIGVDSQLNAGAYAGTITNNGVFSYTGTAAQTLSGAISGLGRLEVTGTGAVTLTGANSYQGATLVGSNASVTVSGGAGSLRGTSSINVAEGGTLLLNGTNLLVAGHNFELAASRTITVSGGTLMMGTAADLRLGHITLRDGATWTSDRGLGAYDVLLANVSSGPATVNIAGSGVANMNGTGGIHLQGVQHFNVADTTGSPAVDLDVSMILGAQGTIAGAAGGVRKTGPGTMLMSAANTYTGETIVDAGTMQLTGSVASPVTVNSGGTLSLTGSIGGNLAVNNGGTLALSLAATPESQAPLTIGGTAVLNSGNILTLTAPATPANGVYLLATATGGMTYTSGSLVLNGFSGVVSANANDLILTIGAVASPYSTWAAAKGLTSANNGGTLDPDFDGIANQFEFALGGNPLASEPAILPTLTTTPDNFVYSFLREDDSEAEISLIFQYGTTLGDWTDLPLGAINAGQVTVTENGSAADTVVVTIPRTNAVDGKLFGRLKSVK